MRYAHRLDSRRAGSAPTALVFWIFALALFGLPFLRAADRPNEEGDDWGRLESEIDLPFDQEVARFEEEIEAGLAEAIAAASEELFGLESEALRDAGIVDVGRIPAGAEAYAKHCMGCHGVTGDGSGPAARHLSPRPRNFRRGIFKFTSTPSGDRPLRSDLFATLTRGLFGSSMPNFRLLPDERRWDLVEYVRYLAIRGEFEQMMLELSFDEEEIVDPDEAAEITVERWSPDYLRATYPGVPEPEYDEDSVEAGRELYFDALRTNCAACHGETGIGDGPSATEFADEWGYPVAPRDLTTGVYRAGGTAADLYRSIDTGINGTPMPSFGGSLAPEEIWALVHFLQSLAR